MRYQEITQDLFAVDPSYHLAHCISADAKMGAGIAKQFKRRFNLNRTSLLGQRGQLDVGQVFPDGRVFNLVTKEKYWHKPTYQTLRQSLEQLKLMSEVIDVQKIAMPAIGAGLDRLDWSQNRRIIQEVFQDTDIEIFVCMQ